MKKSTAVNGMRNGFLSIVVIVGITLFFTGNLGGEIKDKAMDGPEITVNRTHLNYGAIKENSTTTSSATSYQNLLISNSGGGTLNWEVTTDNDWLICSPTSGTNSGSVKVFVAACPLPPGAYNGSITVKDSTDPMITPQTVSVNLFVKTPSQDHPPFGSFATPQHNSTVSSSVPVTGWVLDDVEVDNVKIYNGSSYVGDAVFVEGARPDVEQGNPDSPLNYRAGWGYMMLTNFLPGGGNGTYHLSAVATDSEGNKTTLGSKTIICDNANAVKPFGAIDTPTQGGTASGSSFINWGWALTPQPKHIPFDGSTINVFVDGVNKGHPHYNIYRKDIATLFPDNANSDGAVGYFPLDTTTYHDGVHTIYWTATDNEGRTDGIGSRYFTIQNPNGGRTNAASHRIENFRDLPIDKSMPVTLKKVFSKGLEPQEIYPDNEGLIKLEMKELGLIKLNLSHNITGVSQISGYMVVGNQLHSLPIGSTLDAEKGIFYWHAGPGFFGRYHFVFIEKGQDGQLNRKNVMVNIVPKFE